MGNDLTKRMSKDDISNKLTVTGKKFMDMPNTSHYSFFYDDELAGYGSVFVDDKKEKVDSFMFYPLHFVSELRGNGIGQAAYFLLLEKAVLDMDMGLDSKIEREVKNMSDSSRKMLNKMGIFNNSQEYSNDAVFVTQVASLIEMTQNFLRENGYDVEALLSNIESNSV